MIQIKYSRSNRNVNEIYEDIQKCVVFLEENNISSPSLHILCHYPSFIEMYGDIINYNTMPFERHYRYIKNININNSKVIKSLMNGLIEIEDLYYEKRKINIQKELKHNSLYLSFFINDDEFIGIGDLLEYMYYSAGELKNRIIYKMNFPNIFLFNKKTNHIGIIIGINDDNYIIIRIIVVEQLTPYSYKKIRYTTDYEIGQIDDFIYPINYITTYKNDDVFNINNFYY